MHSGGCAFIVDQGGLQFVFECIDRIKGLIEEVFLAQVVPYMFLGIELGRVRGQRQQTQMVWQADGLTAMQPAPSSTITTRSFG